MSIGKGKLKWLVASIVLLMLAVGFVVGKYWLRSGYDIVHPHYDTLDEAIYGLGTVRSSRVYEHKLGIQTTITKLWVDVGQPVKQGQLLIEFQDNPPLRAPFSGTVTDLPFHENENIFPQIVVIRLEDLGARYVEVALEQEGALRVRTRQKAKLSFESLRGALFTGAVESIYPASGQFLVRIQPDSLSAEILPGMTADVAIEVAHKEKALVVPARAVSGGRVTLLNGRRQSRREIKVGVSNGEWIEVLPDQLTEEDRILVPRQ